MSSEADLALTRLLEGNRRFVEGITRHPRRDGKRRKELTQGQEPFAVVLTCSDSRVVPEVLFDMGLGDIFGIQVAGNVLDDVVLGSIEYAVAHLNTKLVMVLGHEKCGAVTAAVEGAKTGDHIESIVEALGPAAEHAQCCAGEDPIKAAISFNILSVTSQLEASEPVMNLAVDKMGVKVVPAIYRLESGKVEVLGRN